VVGPETSSKKNISRQSKACKSLEKESHVLILKPKTNIPVPVINQRVAIIIEEQLQFLLTVSFMEGKQHLYYTGG
jgi:hypothetical protein